MALSGPQKSDVRRHLGYPTTGQPLVGPGSQTFSAPTAGWRYFKAFGQLENRLNSLPPFDEARLMGLAHGAIAFVGGPAAGGELFTITITSAVLGGPEAFIVTAQAGDTVAILTGRVAAAAALNTVLQSAGFTTTGFSGDLELPLACVVHPVPFTISIAQVASQVAATIVNQGALVEPFAIVDTSTIPPTTRYGYIPILNWLEGAHAGTTDNLDTTKADVWTARSDEQEARDKLYRSWQKKLSLFLDIPRNSEIGQPTGGAFRVVQ